MEKRLTPFLTRELNKELPVKNSGLKKYLNTNTAVDLHQSVETILQDISLIRGQYHENKTPEFRSQIHQMLRSVTEFVDRNETKTDEVKKSLDNQLVAEGRKFLAQKYTKLEGRCEKLGVNFNDNFIMRAQGKYKAMANIQEVDGFANALDGYRNFLTDIESWKQSIESNEEVLEKGQAIIKEAMSKLDFSSENDISIMKKCVLELRELKESSLDPVHESWDLMHQLNPRIGEVPRNDTSVDNKSQIRGLPIFVKYQEGMFQREITGEQAVALKNRVVEDLFQLLSDLDIETGRLVRAAPDQRELILSDLKQQVAEFLDVDKKIEDYLNRRAI